MKKATTNPKNIILWHNLGTTSDICNLVQDANWFKEHPIPVFVAPKEFSRLGMYMPNDGHKRTIAAIRNNIEIVPILILEDTEDISKTIGINSIPYEIVYESAIKTIREKYAPDQKYSFLLRLKNARMERYIKL